jgi:beta-lactam-binding protein with PASTA domain
MWLALVVLLAVVAALAGWYFGIARFTVTPGVIDMSRTAAQTKLDQSGLDLKVTGTAYSETVRKGFVVSTDPAPGDRVAKEGTVGAVLSLGPERHQVPDVRGRTLDDAQQMLDDAKLAYGDQVQRYDEKVPKGRVVTSDPVPGTSLHRNAAVDIVVSKGPKPIPIPNFTGKRADNAAQRLGQLGFKVDTTQVNSDIVALGRVISQSPASGNGVKGDVISLVVSKGPVLVQVPNVRGMGLQAATDRLQAAGFQVQVRHASLYVGVMYVVGTDPSGGTMARKGSTVIVSIV